MAPRKTCLVLCMDSGPSLETPNRGARNGPIGGGIWGALDLAEPTCRFHQAHCSFWFWSQHLELHSLGDSNMRNDFSTCLLLALALLLSFVHAEANSSSLLPACAVSQFAT
jgi:hypothetical protein